MPKTKIFGHRGAMGHYPENTMLGFNKAQEMGADGIEIDVHLTKDKQVVVMHDENLDRTTTDKGLIKDWKIFDLKKVKTGMKFKKLPKYNETWHKERVPELFEVLALVAKDNMVINIELKTDVHEYPGIEREVHHVVASHGMKERVVFSSFNLETLKRLKKHDSNVRIAYLTNKLPKNYEEMMDKYDLEAIHLNVKSALENIGLMKEKGIFFRIWTVNDREQMQQLIDAGVRGIITDYPDTALEIKEN
ncbi:MAG TPA: glycerophosphodiester phosphodiesterase [Candidatus Salinicoccus merdavium]|nr:glycerophosphodiester phosphodiesterase [Candidatus Salinicoccus merdavium]